MAIESGKLRHRLSLQRNHPTQDSTGDLIDDWREYGKAWAAIEPLSARDLISAQAGQSKVVARIVIRHRTGILSTDRIVHGSAVYKIEGLLPDKDSGLEYLTIPVSTGVSINGQ